MSIKNPLWYELPRKRWVEMAQDGYRMWTDSQMQKLYDAENALKRWMRRHSDKKFVEFDTIEQAQEYANKFLTSAWVVKRFGKQEPITVFVSPKKTATSGFRSASTGESFVITEPTSSASDAPVAPSSCPPRFVISLNPLFYQ